MKSFKKLLLTAFIFIGNAYSPSIPAENCSSLNSFEERLQQIESEVKEAKRLQWIFDVYWEWRMSEHPDEATYLGYPGKHDRWPTLSLERIFQQQDFTKKLLKALLTIDPHSLTEEDSVSYQILAQTLQEEIEEFKFNGHYLLIDQMYGIHMHAALILDLMPTQTMQDYEAIITRLNQLPLYFQQTMLLLNKGIETGITPPQVAIRYLPQQVLNQITEEALDSPFLQAFKRFPSSIAFDGQMQLLEQARQVYHALILPSLKEFYSYLVDTYLPNCRTTTGFSDLPMGKAWYAHQICRSTTTTLDPLQIHEIGLREVKRIHQEMLTIASSTGFANRFEDFLHFLKTDPQFFYSSREELLNGYRSLTRHIESKLTRLFNKLPSLPFEVIPIPTYSEESQIAAYYCHGSLSHQRPGYFFINTSYLEKRPKWEMEPLALHEAVPGHHLQITLAQELNHLPEFRKNCHFTAYIEGWGLYSESLGTELGLYQDPYSQFGRLSCEMLRAIRLVVDTGLHAMGWSREEAIQFFKQYVAMSEHEIITEVDRYLVMPGQALAYKIGELKIKEMRDYAAQKLGGQFDIKAFHDEWLKRGTVPLDIAEKALRQWVEEESRKLLSGA